MLDFGFLDCDVGVMNNGMFVSGMFFVNVGGGSFDCMFFDGLVMVNVKVKVSDLDNVSMSVLELVDVIMIVNVVFIVIFVVN